MGRTRSVFRQPPTREASNIFELYRGDSYVGTTLQNMRREVNYLLARVAAAESSSRDQIRQEMDAAIYK